MKTKQTLDRRNTYRDQVIALSLAEIDAAAKKKLRGALTKALLAIQAVADKHGLTNGETLVMTIFMRDILADRIIAATWDKANDNANLN